MKELVSEVGIWLWRLVPGNPIVVRVVSGGSRRTRHLSIRVGYLTVLLLVVLLSQMSVGGGSAGSLTEQAKNATKVFAAISYVQLALMCFLAPVLTAGAITQEKDAQTFNILLTTPLSNAQIVLGSLLSRLFFVVVLLLSGLPIFCMTMLYGGVMGRQIFLSFGLAGCTALITGSLAIAVSMMKVGTRRTIFTFYMAIAVYLMLVLALGLWSGTGIPEAPTTATQRGASWLTPFHPFLSLMAAMGTMRVPSSAELHDYNVFWRWALSRPYSAYMVLTTAASVLLVGVSTLAVRRGVREGETTRWSRFRERILPRRGHLGLRRRSPRTVWRNPVAWREAVTRASAASQSIMRYVIVLGGLTAAGVIWFAYVFGWEGFTAADARNWLTALILIEFVVMLLLATNTAATAITREREANTMELLLATPLTSRYIVRGKLRGLVSFTIPLIAVPFVSVAAFVAYDALARTRQPVLFPEAAIELPALMLVYSAFACMLGLHTSLRSRRTVQAVITSVGTLILLGFGVGSCGFLFTSGAADTLGPAAAPLAMVVGVAAVLNPSLVLSTGAPNVIQAARPTMLVGTAVAIAVYGLIVHQLYRNMVRTFDMTMRRQSV